MSIRTLRQYITRKKREGRQIREIFCPRNAGELLLGCPFQIDDLADANIILKEDTFAELGPPGRASCHFILISPNPGRLKNGRMTLIGPDISEAASKTLPFGQVLVFGGAGLTADHYPELEQCQYIANRLPGYMIRFSPRRMWSRVSHAAAGKGFSLEIIARNLMALYKSKFPWIEAMEVMFITSSDEDVTELSAIARGSKRKVSRVIQRRDDCSFAWDCDDCPNKPICERIRDMARLSRLARKRRNGGMENRAKTVRAQ